MKTTRIFSPVLRWSSLVLASLVSLCCATDAGAYTTGQFLPGTNSSNNYSSVAVGPANVFYGGWKWNEPTPSTESHLQFATYNAGTGTWTEIPGASFTGSQLGTPLGGLNQLVDWGPESLVVDGSGNIHVVLGVGTANGGSPGARGLAYGKFTASSSTWAFRRLFIVTHPSGFRNVGNGEYSLKLDSNQRPHVVFTWSDASDDPTREARLIYAFHNGTDWNVTGVTNALDGIQIDMSDGSNQEGVSSPDIVFDSAGNLHCCYSKEDTDSISGDCWYSMKAVGGSTWTAPIEVADLNNFLYGSIVVDPSDKVHISSRSTSTNTVNYRITSNVSGSWVTSIVATYTFPGATTVSAGDPILKINSAGRRVIANTVKGNPSIGNTLRIVYETSPGTWTQEEAATAAGTLTFNFPSMTLRSDNTIMVIHSRQVASNDRNTYFATGIPAGYGGAPAGATVSSLTRVGATPTNASSVSWTLTFGSAVTGVTASNFSITGAGATGASIGTPTTSNGGVSWTIPVTTGSDGLLTLNLANSTGLTPSVTTALPYAGESYTIDKSPPTVLTVTRMTPSNQTTNLTTVVFRVTYSEPVTLNAPESGHFVVVPVNGSNIVGSVTGVTGTGATRDVTVNLTSGLGEFRLRVID